MISSLVAFLQDRSLISANLYSFIYVVYYGLLVAVGLLAIARFPLRGSVMAVIMLLYSGVTLLGTVGSSSLLRVQPPSNLNVIRLVLLVAYLTLFFNCFFSASSRIGGRKT